METFRQGKKLIEAPKISPFALDGLQDITDDRIRTDISPDCASNNRSFDFLQVETPCRKSFKIATDQTVQIGSPWLSSTVYNRCLSLNTKCWKIFIRRSFRILSILYQILAVISNLIVITIVMKAENIALGYPVAGIAILLLFAIMIVFSLQIKRVLNNLEQRPLYDIIYIILMFFYSFCALYFTIMLIIRGKALGWVLFGLLFSIGLLENLNIILWGIIVPFLAVFVVCEFFVRLVICDLSCPKMHQIIRDYSFMSFKYNPNRSANEHCTICLSEYATGEEVCGPCVQPSHIFHEECITEWLKKNNSCPICRLSLTFK